MSMKGQRAAARAVKACEDADDIRDGVKGIQTTILRCAGGAAGAKGLCASFNNGEIGVWGA